MERIFSMGGTSGTSEAQHGSASGARRMRCAEGHHQSRAVQGHRSRSIVLDEDLRRQEPWPAELLSRAQAWVANYVESEGRGNCWLMGRSRRTVVRPQMGRISEIRQTVRVVSTWAVNPDFRLTTSAFGTPQLTAKSAIRYQNGPCGVRLIETESALFIEEYGIFRLL